MPQALLAVLPVIFAGVGAGLAVKNAVSGPGGGGQPTPAQITQNAIASETSRRQTAIQEAGQLLPGLQADTSGGLSPDAYKDLASTFSGNADLSNSPQMQQLIMRFLGIDQGSTFGGDQPFGSSNSSNNFASPGLTGGG